MEIYKEASIILSRDKRETARFRFSESHGEWTPVNGSLAYYHLSTAPLSYLTVSKEDKQAFLLRAGRFAGIEYCGDVLTIVLGNLDSSYSIYRLQSHDDSHFLHYVGALKNNLLKEQSFGTIENSLDKNYLITRQNKHDQPLSMNAMPTPFRNEATWYKGCVAFGSKNDASVSINVIGKDLIVDHSGRTIYERTSQGDIVTEKVPVQSDLDLLYLCKKHKLIQRSVFLMKSKTRFGLQFRIYENYTSARLAATKILNEAA